MEFGSIAEGSEWPADSTLICSMSTCWPGILPGIVKWKSPTGSKPGSSADVGLICTRIPTGPEVRYGVTSLPWNPRFLLTGCGLVGLDNRADLAPEHPLAR